MIDYDGCHEWDELQTHRQKGNIGDLDIVGKIEPEARGGSQLVTVYCKETKDFICTGKEADFKQLIKDISQAIKRFSVE